ncbi:hypothetical protein L1987_40646 [Smallanthus sonchifolius]|uniref:Uncharacterized protein n=1 Tax=Smallanthus sonchifolius TaxID=185202 RepID=A0ACB9GUH5_9ASTR|nr:hypothetical protein L1987_40646 [Smallanthus sonchifolius]
MMGNLCDMQCIENLFTVCEKDGFSGVEKICGGNWVLLEFPSVESMGWIVWLEIYGLPFCAWMEKLYRKVVEIIFLALSLDKIEDEVASMGVRDGVLDLNNDGVGGEKEVEETEELVDEHKLELNGDKNGREGSVSSRVWIKDGR